MTQNAEEFIRSLSLLEVGEADHTVQQLARGVRYILTYMMSTAEQQHRRRAKADVCVLLWKGMKLCFFQNFSCPYKLVRTEEFESIYSRTPTSGHLP